MPKRRDLGGKTCQMTFADAPAAHPTAVAVESAYVGRIVTDVGVVAAASRPGQPCFDSDSVEGKDRWFRVGRVGLVGNFARGRPKFWASFECAGKGLAVCPGWSKA